MERLIFVPIEKLEERYSAQWYDWFVKDFATAGIKYSTVGDVTTKKVIQTGQFLDVYDTNAYKLTQLQQIIQAIKDGWEGTLFFMDMWFPGLDMIAYIRDNAKRKIRIEGILHAGTWDDWDFLSQNGCRPWGRFSEASWLTIADKVYVATDFHRHMIQNAYMGVKGIEFEVVTFPCITNPQARLTMKRPIVVFPHRLAIEKAPEDFKLVEKMYRARNPKRTDVQFVRSKDVCMTKDDYYKLLSMSKVAFSGALQETFGIAMVEAQNFGCWCVAPDRLSYKETMSQFKRYNTLDEAVELIEKYLDKKTLPDESRYTESVMDIVRRITI